MPKEAEGLRTSAETDRKHNEESRSSAERNRESAESIRARSENDRVTAEQSRATAESTRTTAETKRETAEALRVQNETERQTSIAKVDGWISEPTNLVDVDRLSGRLKIGGIETDIQLTNIVSLTLDVYIELANTDRLNPNTFYHILEVGQ